MVNRRNTRNNGTSGSNARAASVAPPLEGEPLVEEHTSAHSIEERVRRMEDSQMEILRLLRERQSVAPANQEGNPTLQNLPSGRDIRPGDNFLGPSRQTNEVQRATQHNVDLVDTASSTHPSRAAPRENQPVIIEGLGHSRLNSTPRRILREEIRRVVEEDFSRDRNNPHPHRGIKKSSPLIQEIFQNPIPIGFKLPSLDSYDGTTDPYEHVDHYRTIMSIQRASDAVLCQVFPATLKSQARTWFYSLPNGTIHTFDELAKLFAEQFIANRKVIKDSSHLSGIRQIEGESLREYFQRFANEARQIPGVDPELLRGVFLGGLRPGPFYSSLMRETVKSYGELVVRVEAQISADEAIITHRKQFEQTNGKRKKSNAEGNTQQPPSKKYDQGKRDLPPRSPYRKRNLQIEKEYTPLNTRRENILMEIQNEKVVKWPHPLKQNAGDQEQYCRFHRSRGHSTEACRHLKEEIERLINQGYLKRFVQNQPARERTPRAGGQATQNQSRDNRPSVGEIETIAGPLLNNQVLITNSGELKLKKPRIDHSITFDDSDLEGVKFPHQDPLVIHAGIGDPCYKVKRILIDNGSSVDVLFYSTFLKLGLSKEKLQSVDGPLYGFDNRPVAAEGSITLPVTLGEFPRQITHSIQFIVVQSESAYNAIFGRPLQTMFGAIASIPHLKMKFPTPSGIGVVQGNQQDAQSCYLRQVRPPTMLNIENFDLRDEYALERAVPVEDLINIPLSEEQPTRVVRIGSLLPKEQKLEYMDFLHKNQDVFAWESSDMPGIDPEIIVHSLKIDPKFKPVIQKKRNFAPERLQIIEKEVDKLLEAGFIREVHYPKWLANVVLVKKSTGAWRMCVDYTDLNKACPKDSFPLPRIDQLVDATSGHQMLSFMDAYSGYNQIKMDTIDEEATSFQTDKGIYCYQVMPFGLKNAGATYQRLMNKVFKDHIGRTMEVYVDDMLVKSLEKSQHIGDLDQCFHLLRRYNMRLNPSKCAFGVTSGKFLGFMVTHRGIEANPEKIKALRDMTPPRNIKEVQRLTGRIAALSHFLARSGDKYLPFFKTLRGARSNGFQWTDECQAAFEQLRVYLATPPLLSKPVQGEKLYVYLAVSSNAVSSVLVRMENATQRPVYYVSKVLSDTEERYPLTDKTALALVFSARRLRPYFQAHTIDVCTHLPLKTILQKPDTSGRLMKWAVELGEFDINFVPRPDIKSQVLADFIVECTIPLPPEQQSPTTSKDCWKLFVDGASGNSKAGAGLLLISPRQHTLEYALRLKFPATNNVAEYEALIAGLRLAIDCEAQNLIIYTDSQVVASQVEGDFETRDPQLAQYCCLVQALLIRFETQQIIHVLREHNTRADALSKLATSTTCDLYKRRHIEDILLPSIDGQWVIHQVDNSTESSWMDPLSSFLQNGILPEDPHHALRIKRQAMNFAIIGGELFKRSFTGPYLKCLPPSEAEYAMKEVHSGICGDHLGGRALAFKILRQGFYWPTMKQDALDFTRKCNSCQLHSNLTHVPSEELSSLQSPWPFAQWGIDIMGPFPMATGQRKFIILAIDYFTKWVEAEPLAKITEVNAKQFVWKGIICRFGIPAKIITDNGTQFTGKVFTSFCKELHIQLVHTAVSYPQTNGQTEVTNRIILKGLKTRLEKAGGQWTEELPNVLWAYRTTSRTPTGETPYNLCFGAEAIIPVDIGVPSPKVQIFNQTDNEIKLRYHLDLITETRDTAMIKSAAYQQRVARHYNRRLKPRPISVGDLVLRSLEAAGKGPQRNKLSPLWEGPYLVAAMVKPGTFKLKDSEGKMLPRTWNIRNLRRYYQ